MASPTHCSSWSISTATTSSSRRSTSIDLDALGLPADRTYRVRDLLTDRTFDWSWDNFVSLAPWADVAHILSVEY